MAESLLENRKIIKTINLVDDNSLILYSLGNKKCIYSDYGFFYQSMSKPLNSERTNYAH